MKIFNINQELILETKSESLRGANLSCANLREANFYGADLRGSDLRGSDLRGSNFQYANFYGANLSGANLSGTDLQYSDLRGADLRGSDLIVLKMNLWTAYITTNHIRIGCQSHDLSKWENFTDDEISYMHPEALDYWKKNKGIIISLCKRFNEKGE